MLYRAILLSGAILAGFVAPEAKAQDSGAQLRWSGPYAGVGFASHEAEASVAGSAVHRYEKDSNSIALYGGTTFVTPGGFAWGPEVLLSTFSTPGGRTDAALGTTEFKGSFVLSPRMRLGYATDRAYFYGLLGIGISDLAVRPANASGTDLIAGGAVGLGMEYATGQNWALRVEATGYGFDIDDRNINGTNSKLDHTLGQFTLGFTRRF